MPDEQIVRDGLTHAWNWFALHANQRMQAFNFFLVSSAFLISGYGYALNADSPEVSFVVALLGVAMCIVFWGLEKRNRELVKAGEDALRQFETMLAQTTHVPDLKILEKIERPTAVWTSHGKLIPVAEAGMSLAFLASAIYALNRVTCVIG